MQTREFQSYAESAAYQETSRLIINNGTDRWVRIITVRHLMLGFLRPLLYVRIHPEILSVRNARTGLSISEPPLVAISGGINVKGSNLQGGTTVSGSNPAVVAVGHDAKALLVRKDLRIVNPFAHPRTPLSDFTVAELLIKSFIRKLAERKALIFAPTMVLHLAVELDGGITQIEARALRELGLGAGAKRCYGWLGPDLTDTQLVEWEFPRNGTVV